MRRFNDVSLRLPPLALLAIVCSLPAAAHVSQPVRFTVWPAAAGPQVVRTALPLPPGFLATNQACVVTTGNGKPEPAALRAVSWHPATATNPSTARRALVTFPHRFVDTKPVEFKLQARTGKVEKPVRLPVTLHGADESFTLAWNGGSKVELRLIAPPRTSTEPLRIESVEDNRFYRWQRIVFPDRDWPCIIEFRFDAAGTVVAVAHLQRTATNDCYAPELGWELGASAKSLDLRPDNAARDSNGARLNHSFAQGVEATCLMDRRFAIYHPTAPLKRRGEIQIIPGKRNSWTYRYLRCRTEDQVPMQPMSWQRAEVVIAPPGLAKLTGSLASPHRVEPERKLWSALYGHCESLPDLPPVLDELVRYHREAVVRSAAVGDDFGNVTGYNDGAAHGPAFGMNRLNHGAPIFQSGWHSGDRRLTEIALLWCDNFYDQSIWWGEPAPGGTRYNNRARFAPTPDQEYMWRSDTSVSFCTKGYDCFWLAWEETGDPRMLEAFRAQVAYATESIHVNTGECRNIGDVRDFIRLYRYTGEQQYLDEALRLFRELRTKLSTGHLFDQGGKPLDPDPPFLDEDQRGLKIGYAKPYIIGYALAGLPELVPYAPDEPDLQETIRAVADFLASTVDPAGGWRYPHPRSSAVSVSQGMEHAWHLTQAARALGPEPKWLDAIELVLRARIHGWRHTGKIFSGLEGWEISTGKVKDRKELYDVYQKPGDRDASRDYSDGNPSFGSAPPEGIVYFEEVLGYYLQHRPVARLLAEPKSNEPLGQVLARAPKKKL